MFGPYPECGEVFVVVVGGGVFCFLIEEGLQSYH